MRQLFVLLLFFQFGYGLFGQCPKGMVHLSSNEQIEQFTRKYPNCTELDSSLLIGPTEDMRQTRISDLSKLSNIILVNGDFKIWGNPLVRSLTPIENITIVNGNAKFGVYHANNLYMPKLELVKGNLQVECHGYEECQIQFKELIKVGGDLYLWFQKMPEKMFPSLWKIGGSVSIISSIGSNLNDRFPLLTEVGGALSIDLNDRNEDHYLPNLKKVKRLSIYGQSVKPKYIGELMDVKELIIGSGVDCEISVLKRIDSLERLIISELTPNLASNLSGLRYVNNMDINQSKEISDSNYFKKLEEVNKLRVGTLNTLSYFHDVEILKELRVTGMKSLEKSMGSFPKGEYDLIFQYNQVDSLKVNLGGNIQRLKVTYNEVLQTISMDNGVLNELNIVNNQSLTSIQDLNLKVNPKGRINIAGNKNLENCHCSTICDALKAGNIQINLYNNGSECTIENLKRSCNHN